MGGFQRTAGSAIRRLARRVTSGPALAAAIFFLLAAGLAPAAVAQPAFSKAFSPSTIGPGSVSTLTFVITNDSASPVTDLAFSDILPTLPGAVVIASPAAASTNCGLAATLTAPAGGGTITFSGGTVGAGRSCTVKVNVTSSTVGTHANLSGDLTSSAGNSGKAAADLVVAADRPGFLKSFSPSTVPLGGRSTLTFTIDNLANSADRFFPTFIDNLPTGMVVASPPNVVNTCFFGLTGPGTVTATPGSGVITLTPVGAGVGAVEKFSTCEVEVDVVATGAGTLPNTSGDLTTQALSGGSELSSGKAGGVLTVTVGPLHISKSFLDDPVPPGGTVTLEFKIRNFDRDNAYAAISFDDDLDAALTDLEATGATVNTCGGMATSSFPTGLFEYAGGVLGPSDTCTIALTLSVPPAATPGAYTNTTGPVSGTILGDETTGNAASDTLFVVEAPILTKEFTDDPVGAGGTATLEFTITNTSPTSSADDIAFFDEFDVILPTAVEVDGTPAGPGTTVVSDCCGAGSTCTFTPLFDPAMGSSTPARFELEGGTVGVGSSCIFDLVLDVLDGAAEGFYPNTTSEITATVGAASVAGPPASDLLEVLGAPTLTKEFTDDPVLPGGEVTLQFTLSHSDDAPADAVDIEFMDDLALTLTGLAAKAGELPKSDLCDPDGPGGAPGTGTMTGSAGDTLLDVSSASLAPGESCTFSVVLTVSPTAAAGIHENETTEVTATVSTVAVTGLPAEDDLTVAGLVLTKEFIDDPALPGGTVTLEFTLANVSASESASSITFTDNLDDVISGLAAATGELPKTDLCDPDGPGGAPATGTMAGSAGDTFLTVSGASLAAGESCTFSVVLDVPTGTVSDTYVNTTASFNATFGGTPSVLFPNAVADLVVSNELLLITKSFTDDPVAPGGTVTLRFEITNLSASETIDDIEFTDDLGAALTDLEATGATSNTCGGMATFPFPTDFFGYDSGSLGPGASCEIVLTLDVPGTALGGLYTNTTSPVTGTIGALAVIGDPATDNLRVAAVDFSKAFAGPVVAGETVVLTFTLKNLDAASAVGPLEFTDNLEAMLTGAVATDPDLPKSDVCDPDGPGGAPGTGTLSGTFFVTLTGVSLPAGATCSFGVTVSIPASTLPGSYTNTTSKLRSAGVPIEDPAVASLTVVGAADLALAKTDSPDPVAATELLTYTVTVTNLGPSVAQGVVVSDTLPAGVTFVSTSGCAEDAGGVPTCTLGTIAAGAFKQYTITVSVDASTLGIITNTASVAATTPDPDLGNNADSEDTLVEEPTADLSVTLAPLDDPTAAQRVLLWEAVVENLGPQDATGVTFEMELPAGAYFLGVEPFIFPPCTLASGVALSCDLGDLASGAMETVTVGTFIDGRFDGTLASEAMVSGDETDPDPMNNEDDASAEVRRARSILATTDASGDPLTVSVLKEFEEAIGLVARDAATGLVPVFGVAGPGYRTVALAEVPDFDDTPAPEVAALGFGFDGSTRVFVFDADSMALLSELPVTPAASPRVPIDLVSLPSFDGTPAPELALLFNDLGDGSVHVVAVDAGDGALLRDVTVIGPGFAFFGLGMEVLSDFSGSPTPELGVVSRGSLFGDILTVSLDLDLGAPVTSVGLGGFGLFPLDVAAVDAGGGSPDPELAVLSRRPADGALVALPFDLPPASLGILPEIAFDPDLQPADMQTVPDFDGTPAPELAVLGREGLDVVIEVIDTGSSGLVGTTIDSSLPKVPVPLGLAVHPDFGGDPDPDLSALVEFDLDPTQVNVSDAGGPAPFLIYFLP